MLNRCERVEKALIQALSGTLPASPHPKPDPTLQAYLLECLIHCKEDLQVLDPPKSLLSNSPGENPREDLVTFEAIEQAISAGLVTDFSDLDYCLFRICEQHLQILYSVVPEQQRIHQSSEHLTQQQLRLQICKLVQSGLENRWLAKG